MCFTFLLALGCYSLKKGDKIERQWGSHIKQLEREGYTLEESRPGKWGTTEFYVNLDSLYGIVVDSSFFDFFNERFVGATFYFDEQFNNELILILEKKLGKLKKVNKNGPIDSYFFEDINHKKSWWHYEFNHQYNSCRLSLMDGNQFSRWLATQSPEYLDTLQTRIRRLRDALDEKKK